MIKFILHGGDTKADNENNRKFAKEIAKDLSNNFVLLLVFFLLRKIDMKMNLVLVALILKKNF